MADQDPLIVDVQGIGPVQFPAGTSGAQIEAWVLGKLREAGVPSQTWGQWLGNMGARVGGGIAGGVVGSLAGPVGTFAGTATGAALGDEWAQSREVAQGVRGAVNPLEMVAAGVTAPIPGATLKRGAPLLRQVPKALAASVPGAAASSAGLQLAETGTVDPWRLAMETGRGSVLGGVIGLGVHGGIRGAQSQAAQKLVRDETGAIRVYHGSPHDFDQFDISKIGTGEGAQAYGHGLYFAEREGVAQSYKHALGNRAFKVGDRELVSPMGGSTRALDTQTRAENIAAQALDDAIGAQSSSPAQFAANRLRMQAREYPEEAAHIQDALEVIHEWQKTGEVHKMGGRMYEVNIDADPEHFLDWDAPITEQPPIVRKALGVPDDAEARLAELEAAAEQLVSQQVAITQRPGAINERGYLAPDASREYQALQEQVARVNEESRELYVRLKRDTGETAYRDLNRDPKAAAAALKGGGVAGVRYLDQDSRDAGEGSRNYAVFDDQLISILRKYGLLPFVPLSQVGRPSPDERDRQK